MSEPSAQEPKPPTHPTTVMLVDDHPLTLFGLQLLVKKTSGLVMAGTASNPTEALRKLDELDPDLVCLDLAMPGPMDGIDVCKRVRELRPETQVIIYTASEEPGLPLRAREAGALACVAKSDDFRNLRRAMLLAVHGKPFVSQIFSTTQSYVPPTDDGIELSDRQREIIEMVAEGLTNTQIANKLAIGPESVKTHVQNVMRKLGAHDRTQAAVIALRRGLID